jgi:hypothetical protein
MEAVAELCNTTRSLLLQFQGIPTQIEAQAGTEDTDEDNDAEDKDNSNLNANH